MTPGTGIYDLFISYRHAGDDLTAVRRLSAQLEGLGLKVFVDESGIDTFEGITPTIRESLSRSKAMLCYFSEHYLTSRACLWELTAAFIAAQRLGGRPHERIFILNPGDRTGDFKKLPIELREAKYALSIETAVQELPPRLRAIKGAFQDLGPLTLPDVFGRNLAGSTRFVGRLTEMWDIHSKLNGSTSPLVDAGHTGPDIALISGLGGMGKSLLAEEYALRFSAAYPGGIYWLEAHGSYNPEQPDIEAFNAACNEQFLKLIRADGKKPPPNASFEELWPMMAGILRDKKQRSLWIVDDIPYGLSDHLDAVKNWLAPHPSAATLITTRSQEYNAIGREIPLDILQETDAIDLFRRQGLTVADQVDQAEILFKRLGRHAMALDIAGAAISNSQTTIAKYLADLDHDQDKLFDVPRELVGALPSGHERSIIQTFKHSLDRLGEAGLNLLRLAANLSPAPIRNEFIELVFRKADELEKNPSKKYNAGLGIAACRQRSLIKPMEEFLQVHALLSATIQYLKLANDKDGQRLLSIAIELLSSLIQPRLDHEQATNIAYEVEHARFLSSNVTDDERLKLLWRVADFDYYRGHLKMAARDWREILSIQEDKKGTDHPDTLTSMGNLAVIFRAMGDHQIQPLLPGIIS